MDELKYVTEDEFFALSQRNQVGPNDARILPMTPWVIIQFRTAVLNGTGEEYLSRFTETGDYNVQEHSEWTTVSFRKRTDGYTPLNNLKAEIEQGGSIEFNNFFDSVELEDNGGLITCNLKLYDPEFGNLEQIILKSILSMKASNEYYSKSVDESDKFMLEFHNASPQNINFRVRFGYADPHLDSQRIIDDADESSGNFGRRVKDESKNKLVIKSTWHYFQMMDCNFSVADAGMYADIKGISVGVSNFERLKIVQRYSQLVGTPEGVIRSLGKLLFESSNGMIQFVDDQGRTIFDSTVNANLADVANFEPDETNRDDIRKNFRTEWGATWGLFSGEGEDTFDNYLLEMYGEENASQAREDAIDRQEDKYRIKVMYGAEPRPRKDRNGRILPGGWERTYMSIKELMKEICSKVPPIYRYEIDEEEKFVTGEEVKNIFANNSDPVTIGGVQYDRGKFKPIRYTYKTREIASEFGTIIRVAFFYARPNLKNQDYVRKYTWRNNQKNLISSFSISSKLDFAQLNSTVAIANGESLDFYMTPPTSSSNPEETGVGAMSKSSFVPTAGGAARLVHSIVEDTDSEDGEQGQIERRTMAQQLVDNLNMQNFNGTVEIPGDPFFKFDSFMEPYRYGIYIDVIRDFNVYGQTLDSPNERSYMSGFYFLSNIKHSINNSGFKTTLGVSKWPTATVRLKER